MASYWFHGVVAFLFGVSSGGLGLTLSSIPVAARPTLGFRGKQRLACLKRSHTFRVLDPLLRIVAAWWATIAETPRLEPWVQRLRQRQARQLERAGHFWGLAPDEYTSLSLLSLVVLLGVAALLSGWLDPPNWVVGAVGGLGLALPYLRVNGAVRMRFRKIQRALPVAIDLVSMCVNAGMDFPGALATVAQGAADDWVVEEFAQILATLHLGHTRKLALQQFEQRVPIDSVREFTRAVIQAEEKGNPIAEVLTVQASISRTQRSVAAEEAAARAGVWMIVPMMFLLGCILLMLMGPFIINGTGL